MTSAHRNSPNLIPAGAQMRLQPSFVPLFVLLGIAGFVIDGRSGALDGLLAAILTTGSAVTMTLGARALAPALAIASVTPLGPIPEESPSPLTPVLVPPLCLAGVGWALLLASPSRLAGDHPMVLRLIWINLTLAAARLLPLPPLEGFRRIAHRLPPLSEQVIVAALALLGAILLLAGFAFSIEAALAGVLLLTASSLARRDQLRRSGRITGRFGRNRP